MFVQNAQALQLFFVRQQNGNVRGVDGARCSESIWQEAIIIKCLRHITHIQYKVKQVK